MPILFDVDDTLVDHRRAAEAAAGALHQRFRDRIGVPLEAFVLRWHETAEHHFNTYATGGCSYQEQRRRRIRDFFGTDLDNREADELFGIYLTEYEAAWALFPDVLLCLDALRNETLGVISNNSFGPTVQKLTATGILDRFAVVMTPDRAGIGKPEPSIFQATCERLKVQPSACVYVGDKLESDAVAASRTGMIGVWLNRPGRQALIRGPVPDGIRTITALAELGGVLREVWS